MPSEVPPLNRRNATCGDVGSFGRKSNTTHLCIRKTLLSFLGLFRLSIAEQLADQWTILKWCDLGKNTQKIAPQVLLEYGSPTVLSRMCTKCVHALHALPLCRSIIRNRREDIESRLAMALERFYWQEEGPTILKRSVGKS